jgi:hypothetical protein
LRLQPPAAANLFSSLLLPLLLLLLLPAVNACPGDLVQLKA